MTLKKWIRDKWPNEAKDFTPWLQDNLNLVGDCIELELYSMGREVAAAGGRADIVAWERNTRNKVVVENQISAADARHFQQLISYGDSLDARIRVWVATYFSNRFERLITNKNNAEELKDQGSVYYLLRLDRRDEDRNQAILRLHVGPTQRQVEQVLLSEGERKSREKLVEAFWNWYGHRRAAIVNVNKREKLYISKFVSMKEASVSVSAWCARGYRRRERVRALNAYARLLLREFPQTNASEKWDFDEVRREILVVKLPVDLSNPDNWQHIREWFLRMEKGISAPSRFPLRYVGR